MTFYEVERQWSWTLYFPNEMDKGGEPSLPLSKETAADRCQLASIRKHHTRANDRVCFKSIGVTYTPPGKQKGIV
jgi:hypothetical protein